MVKTAILTEKIKQYFLWGGLAALSLPTIPLQAAVALNNGINSAMNLLKHGRRPLPEEPVHPAMLEKRSFATVADDHPLRTWADEHARAEGLTGGTQITFDSAEKGQPVRNASVSFENDKAHIRFIGDPEADDPTFVKNIIAHELGHHQAGDSAKFYRQAMNTTSSYAVMAEYGGVGALLLHGLQTVQDHPLVQMVPPDLLAHLPTASQSLMMSAASLVALPLVASLSQKFSHSVEHLADMKSAALTGAQQTIDLFATRHLPQETEYLAHAKEMKAAMKGRKEHVLDFSLVRAWQDTMADLSKSLRDTHPRVSARMEFIAKAYGLETPAASPVATAEAPRHNKNGAAPIKPL